LGFMESGPSSCSGLGWGDGALRAAPMAGIRMW